MARHELPPSPPRRETTTGTLLRDDEVRSGARALAPFESKGTALLQPSRGRLFWSTLPLGLGTLWVFTVITLDRGSLAIYGILLAQLALLARHLPAPENQGTVRVDPDGVRFAGDLLVAHAEIQHALLIPRPGEAPLVRIARHAKKPPLEIRVADEAEGERLIESLGMDAPRAVAHIELPMRYQAYPVGGLAWLAFTALLFGGLSLVGTHVTGSFTVFLAILLVPLQLRSLLRTHLQIGPDGLLIRTLWHRRFVPYRDLGALRMVDANPPTVSSALHKRPERGLLLTLTSGESIRLLVEASYWYPFTSVDAVERRIRTAWAAHDASRDLDEAHLTEVLAPRGRDLPAWLDSLRALGSGASAGPRQAAVPADVLWRMLESPTAPPAARAGAAVALSVSESADPVRFGEAARAVVEPRLRVAIEAASGGRDAELGAVLEALATDEAALTAATQARLAQEHAAPEPRRRRRTSARRRASPSPEDDES
ncbi:hypothetical protein [Chondromyces crocatus]|uniref:Uncharacterized protein n=1 Tax=Chondromyces crocatus TaxID=52 RepID=A0A0K1EH00_CHOCO|nr:hypothetical protein [Chondromyces crocatus]AKT40136.1 uncharacterized protein CMC5_042890 [Chondromyces crocatus]